MDPEVAVTVGPRRPTDDALAEEEERIIRLGAHWRRRRFLITTTIYLVLWFLMVLLIQTGTPPVVYGVLLLPFYLITLLIGLRKPKGLRRDQRPLRARLSFTNKLVLSIVVFLAIYIPFSFVSNRIIPFAPVVEFLLFAGILFLMYYLIGRSVGVAPSVEALPPPSHRRHKQVVLPIDDPHYQRTLFLNFEFVDKGRGGRSLARRLDGAMEAFGVEPAARETILEELEDYREGFHLWFGLTRRGRERRRRNHERRNQVLRSVYAKFNQALEQSA